MWILIHVRADRQWLEGIRMPVNCTTYSAMLPRTPVQKELEQKLSKWQAREWFKSRRLTPPAPPLHPAIKRVIREWFDLVDDDGGGTLDYSELEQVRTLSYASAYLYLYHLSMSSSFISYKLYAMWSGSCLEAFPAAHTSYSDCRCTLLSRDSAVVPPALVVAVPC